MSVGEAIADTEDWTKAEGVTANRRKCGFNDTVRHLSTYCELGESNHFVRSQCWKESWAVWPAERQADADCQGGF
jgi:hypothetical protein